MYSQRVVLIGLFVVLLLVLRLAGWIHDIRQLIASMSAKQLWRPEVSPHSSRVSLQVFGLDGVSVEAINLFESVVSDAESLTAVSRYKERLEYLSNDDWLFLFSRFHSEWANTGCECCRELAETLMLYLGYPDLENREWPIGEDGEVGPGND